MALRVKRGLNRRGGRYAAGRFVNQVAVRERVRNRYVLAHHTYVVQAITCTVARRRSLHLALQRVLAAADRQTLNPGSGTSGRGWALVHGAASQQAIVAGVAAQSDQGQIRVGIDVAHGS